jgi:ABC-type nitrate/sulfonate/bicarbonate transport system permease component
MRLARRVLARVAQYAAVPAALLLLWHVVAENELVNPVFLPTPARVLDALQAQWRSGELLDAARLTVGRGLLGWVLAGVLGVVVAVAVTRSRALADALAPPLDFLRSLPAASIIPPATLLLGYGRSMELTVIVFAAVWPVLLNALHGILATEPQLQELARSIRMSKPRRVFSIELPSAVPSILLGLRTSLAVAIIVAVVAEMLASSGGLGDELIQASRRFRSADVYAFVLVLGAIGATTNFLLQSVERRVLRRTGVATATTDG